VHSMHQIAPFRCKRNGANGVTGISQQVVQIHCFYPGYFHRLHVPHLEVLAVTANTPRRPPIFDLSLPLFAGETPHLSCLRMSGIGLNCELSLLTALHLETPSQGFVTYDHLCQMLTTTTSLLHLSICGNAIQSHPYPSVTSLPQVVMLKLQSLRLHSGRRFGDYVTNPLLRTLRCPSMEILFLSGDSSISPLEYNIGRERYPSLCDLTLRNASFSTSLMQHVAHGIPTITHFTIAHTGFRWSMNILEV
jgi:hypothetical protein